MEGAIDADAPLDYAAFQILPTQNRYEAFVCHDNKIERVASGSLEQLMLDLPKVKSFHPEEQGDSFKLQLPENVRHSAWFSKYTFARFLHIVGAPESLKICKTIGDEMSQLEEARRFHLELYAQGHQQHPGTAQTDGYNSKDAEQTLKLESETASSDPTKNELLRAMDLRLTALREDLAASFTQAAGATCSTKQVTDLVAFCDHFGAMDLRNSLSKYLALRENDQVAEAQNEQSKFSLDSRNGSGKMANMIDHECSPVNTFKAIKYGASPAKAAQVERQNSTGSEESSNSSDEDRSFSERSRPLVRSTSRRSASPMRRIQIGRSGSRKAAALTIKSLSYFPVRERVSSNRDVAGNSSEDEDSIHPPKKPESNVRRMSVQDAISLFESKQRDQDSDLQKKKSADVSVSTNKAVLRRWSSGMGDSSTQCPPENACEGVPITTDKIDVGEMQKSSAEMKPYHDSVAESVNHQKIAETGALLAKRERKTSNPTERRVDILVIHSEEEDDEPVTNSAEWSRQKEAELSQMLKMMEKKPVRYRNMTNANSRSQEFPSEKRGGFYDHYKQKRDEKLRGENSGKRAEKVEQFKALQDILDQRKAEMASKVAGIAGKQNALAKPRKSQKNLSPPVLPKKETSKPAVSRKASPKASPKPSPVPATRKSWPSAPSPKTIGPAPTKTPNGISSTGTTPTRRKSQPTPSPTRTNPKMEKSQQQQKSTKANQIETKRSLKGQEEKQQQAMTRSDKVSKAKALPTPGDCSGPTKPSFYNKVTRKGSVVPLESKPFLRKGTGIGPGVGPGVVKTKASQSDESLKNSGILNKAQEEEVVADTPKPVTQPQEEDIVPPVSDVTDLEPEASVHSHQNCEQTENCDQFVAEGDSCEKTTEFPVEMRSDEVSTISPIAWVEIEEQPDLGASCDNDINPPQIANLTNVAPITSSSPRIRHSLSQMLQEDNGDSEIIEWGNAENPPALVYQKDAPKGLKRLLKFARKSKGEANVTGWSSPSVFSEGEEDAEESKAASKRNSDALLRKAALQASFGESYNGGSSDKRVTDNTTTIHDLLLAQSNISKIAAQSSHKFSEGNISSAATSTKASRSFFSLSTFRSSKSNETKLR